MSAVARRLGLPVIPYEHRNARQHVSRAVVLHGKGHAPEAELVAYPEGVERPVVRADCYRMPRPCPFVSCRHHLYLDAKPNGDVRVNFPDRDPSELRPSCSLDAAQLGALPLEYVAAAMNLTRERIRQIEVIALAKLRRRGLPQ